MSLLNDARIKAKKPTLGFLNPLIYSLGVSGFNDITVGHNSGCGTTGFNVSANVLYMEIFYLIELFDR